MLDVLERVGYVRKEDKEDSREEEHSSDRALSFLAFFSVVFILEGTYCVPRPILYLVPVCDTCAHTGQYTVAGKRPTRPRGTTFARDMGSAAVTWVQSGALW